MASQGNLTINDGQAVPVAHTFVAQGVDSNGVAQWIEKTAGSFIGFLRLTMSAKVPPASTGRPLVHELRLVIPTVVTETINGVSTQKQVRSILATAKFVVPSDSTLAERKDACNFVANTLRDTATGGHFGWQISNQEGLI